MTNDNIKAAIKEATRFVKLATELLRFQQSDEKAQWHSTYPKQSGATRRASMDLTRALAEMRKP